MVFLDNNNNISHFPVRTKREHLTFPFVPLRSGILSSLSLPASIQSSPFISQSTFWAFLPHQARSCLLRNCQRFNASSCLPVGQVQTYSPTNLSFYFWFLFFLFIVLVHRKPFLSTTTHVVGPDFFWPPSLPPSGPWYFHSGKYGWLPRASLQAALE